MPGEGKAGLIAGCAQGVPLGGEGGEGVGKSLQPVVHLAPHHFSTRDEARRLGVGVGHVGSPSGRDESQPVDAKPHQQADDEEEHGSKEEPAPAKG